MMFASRSSNASQVLSPAMRRTYAAGVTVMLTLAACSSSSSSGVPWNDYAPSVRTTIDAAASSKDCTALQAQFNQADANNDIMKSRTGHNNAELMGYIDDAMKAAGCY